MPFFVLTYSRYLGRFLALSNDTDAYAYAYAYACLRVSRA